MQLNNLIKTPEYRKKVKRIGRGPGSGHGKTSCKGHKGLKARSGGSSRRGFEGGQMPLYRRLPKRGFRNLFKKQFAIINITDLEVFEEGQTIDPEILKNAGLIKKLLDGLKILGQGEITKALTVKTHKCSKTARLKIEKAGGTIEELPL